MKPLPLPHLIFNHFSRLQQPWGPLPFLVFHGRFPLLLSPPTTKSCTKSQHKAQSSISFKTENHPCCHQNLQERLDTRSCSLPVCFIYSTFLPTRPMFSWAFDSSEINASGHCKYQVLVPVLWRWLLYSGPTSVWGHHGTWGILYSQILQVLMVTWRLDYLRKGFFSPSCIQ